MNENRVLHTGAASGSREYRSENQVVYTDAAFDKDAHRNEKYSGLNIRRFVNGNPATLQQLTTEHMIQNDIAIQAIAAAMGRANNTVQ